MKGAIETYVYLLFTMMTLLVMVDGIQIFVAYKQMSECKEWAIATVNYDDSLTRIYRPDQVCSGIKITTKGIKNHTQIQFRRTVELPMIHVKVDVIDTGLTYRRYI